MNVVIYARFSSHSQTEQSIEGQLKVCYEYAESNHYTVVGEYIDRAISGTTDNRAEFQRMISDSDRHTFEGVLVYQLDRFARNRYDSAINKAKLKKNGVRVLSAKENIADDASGILVEGVLESMAEYYSVELSQKIHRGMAINAEKCLSNGSNPGLGFKVDAERRFYVDEEEAAIVCEIYERYASGETKAEIIRDLKRRRVKTSLGKEFSPNSLSHLLSNKRYIGVYLYKGKETPGGMPRILDDDLFYRVQSMMNKNKNAPARTHGEGEYLLTTKLFCGHCKEMMVGYGGTSKTGRQYHYYMCKNARRKKCGKKIVSKSYIEDRVVNECLKMLTEEKIRFIAKKVAEECAKSPDNLTAKALKKAIREADTAIENLWKAIEQGQAVEMLTERLNKRIAEKAELEAELAIEENKKITLTEAQILAFLDYVCEMPADDVNKRRAIINIFVHSIYLYDDHFTLIINASKKPLSIDNIPLDDIETAFEGETGASEGCSSLGTPAPPKKKRQPLVVSSFLVSPPQAAQPKGNSKCSGEVNSPSAKILRRKMLARRKSAGFTICGTFHLSRATRRVFLFRRRRRLNPRVIQMLGRSEFALRQDFASQNACTAQKRRFLYPWDISQRRPLPSHEVCEHRRASDRKKSRNDDRQAAHCALDLAKLDGLGRTQRVRGRADADALRNGVGDMKEPAHRHGGHIAENARDDDHGDRQGHIAAELFRNAHADGRGDGLGEQRHIFLVRKVKEPAHHKHAAQRSDNTRKNTGKNGLVVLPEEGELFIERHGKADGRRRQKIAEVLCTLVIYVIVDARGHKQRDGRGDGDKKRVAERKPALFLQQRAEAIGNKAHRNTEKDGLFEKCHFLPSPFSFLFSTPCVTRPDTAITATVVTTAMTR